MRSERAGVAGFVVGRRHWTMSTHGAGRAQQRGIPPLVIDWLSDYGVERHDRHGARLLYFDKLARRRLERAVGREPVRRMHEYLDAYLVLSNDGIVVTAGHRFTRIRN